MEYEFIGIRLIYPQRYKNLYNETMGTTRKKDIVQVKNPRTNRYVKIDRSKGRILSHKKSYGAYKGIPVARKRK